MTTQPWELPALGTQYTQIPTSLQDFKKILRIFANVSGMDKITIGKLGEQYARKFLLSLNYRIVACNYFCRFGEIDIIALDQKELVFVEVKTRTSAVYGEPREALVPQKIHKIIKTALYFLNTARGKYGRNLRIDLIAVKLDRNYSLRDIEHFKNISNG